MNIFIFLDSSTQAHYEGIFSLIPRLSIQEAVDNLYIIDRAIKKNNILFYPTNDEIKINHLYGYKVGKDYSFQNRPEPSSQLKFDISEIKNIWLRLDQPVSNESLLNIDKTFPHSKIINNPTGIIKTGKKEFLEELRPLLGDLVPPIKICKTVEQIKEFSNQHQNLVLKASLSFGGIGILRYFKDGNGDINDNELQNFLDKHKSCLAMKFLKSNQQSDNRILVLNGKILGAINRKAPKDGWLCNISAGGSASLGTISKREEEIVEIINPIMKKNKISFYGIDTLIDEHENRYLSELNTTNVGCIRELERFTGKPIVNMIIDNLVSEFSV